MARSGPSTRSKNGKATIAADAALGLRWSVVESLPVHERIKLGEGNLTELFDNYRQSLRNLAHCGINVVCYNFMPVLDWTRTQLDYPLPGGGTALRFNVFEFAAFDCFMLKRPEAEADYSADTLSKARVWFDRSSQSDQDKLLSNIMAGLPGAFDRFDLPGLRKMLDAYRGITAEAITKKSRPLPARSRSDRGGMQHTYVYPPGRPAAPAYGPAAHRLDRS